MRTLQKVGACAGASIVVTGCCLSFTGAISPFIPVMLVAGFVIYCFAAANM